MGVGAEFMGTVEQEGTQSGTLDVGGFPSRDNPKAGPQGCSHTPGCAGVLQEYPLLKIHL